MFITLDARRPAPIGKIEVGHVSPATYHWWLKLAGKEKKLLPNTSSEIDFSLYVSATKDMKGAEIIFDVRCYLGLINDGRDAKYPYRIEVMFRQNGDLTHDPEVFLREGESAHNIVIYRRLIFVEMK